MKQKSRICRSLKFRILYYIHSVHLVTSCCVAMQSVRWIANVESLSSPWFERMVCAPPTLEGLPRQLVDFRAPGAHPQRLSTLGPPKKRSLVVLVIATATLPEPPRHPVGPPNSFQPRIGQMLSRPERVFPPKIQQGMCRTVVP
jgi:hypothetical protein